MQLLLYLTRRFLFNLAWAASNDSAVIISTSVTAASTFDVEGGQVYRAYQGALDKSTTIHTYNSTVSW